MKLAKWLMSKAQFLSILFLSVGVLINALVIPPYQGVALWGSKSDQPIYDFRKQAGYSANSLIVIGTFGQLICLFKRERPKKGAD